MARDSSLASTRLSPSVEKEECLTQVGTTVELYTRGAARPYRWITDKQQGYEGRKIWPKLKAAMELGRMG